MEKVSDLSGGMSQRGSQREGESGGKTQCDCRRQTSVPNATKLDYTLSTTPQRVLAFELDEDEAGRPCHILSRRRCHAGGGVDDFACTSRSTPSEDNEQSSTSNRADFLRSLVRAESCVLMPRTDGTKEQLSTRELRVDLQLLRDTLQLRRHTAQTHRIVPLFVICDGRGLRSRTSPSAASPTRRRSWHWEERLGLELLEASGGAEASGAAADDAHVHELLFARSRGGIVWYMRRRGRRFRRHGSDEQTVSGDALTGDRAW
ncbi:hypothetical protein C8R45DRAFT_941232 [Mycena sanguinolenta]|nr:hypothetical protein C8R45DRAFT_941232 [Mycena sanguinolenta]